jgi:hypothetical protein
MSSADSHKTGNRMIARAPRFSHSSVRFPPFRFLGARPRMSSTKIFVDNYEELRIWFVHEN